MLDTLPLELIEHITRFVGEPGLLNLRQTNRHLHRQTFEAFGKAFFSVVHLSFCIGTFPRLQAIAEDENLRVFVRELRVGEDICSYEGCRDLLPYNHPLGVGYHWPREQSGCLDTTASAVSSSEFPFLSSPSAATNIMPLFRHLLASRLTNCRSLLLSDGCGNRPQQVGSTSILSNTDAVHLLLLAGAGLPVTSFRIEFRRVGAILLGRELPRRVIDSPAFVASWETSLTELRLGCQLEQDEEQLLSVAADLVRRAKALRRLHLQLRLSFAASDFLRRLAAAPEPPPPLTHLDMSSMRGVTPAALSAFLRRFGDTLQYLHMDYIELEGAGPSATTWPSVFAECRRHLSRLECFTVWALPQGPRAQQWLFDPILKWDGVPDSGNLEFSVRMVGERYWVNGVRYKGQAGAAMQKFLLGLEECAYCPDPQIGPARAEGYERANCPDEVQIAGRLRATRIKSKKFHPILDPLSVGFK
ncbi:hypothetical protein QBC46DRAFT_377605 [Diplogelasinospora grovesii]|uniref:F-box domain-containing protein n=1 Tax=Diplogelasinospora grovesii TaxID=303347 RepID=A0AAN6NCP6_9PEZI|nr:hypothetical protein QBC46DRAFT_377605 [Diplogelasinospora grovesii]